MLRGGATETERWLGQGWQAVFLLEADNNEGGLLRLSEEVDIMTLVVYWGWQAEGDERGRAGGGW